MMGFEYKFGQAFILLINHLMFVSENILKGLSVLMRIIFATIDLTCIARAIFLNFKTKAT